MSKITGAPQAGAGVGAATAAVSTLRSARAWGVMLTTIVVGLVVDIATKYWAFRTIAGAPVRVDREAVAATLTPNELIPPHQPISVVPHVLELTLVLNPGAVFGIGAGKRWFFVVLTLVAVGMGMWLFTAWTRPRQWWGHLAVGLVLAGGLGNLYDRLTYACVRDFLHPLPGVLYPMGWSSPWSGREVWPWVSNVADKLLLIGIGVLVWHILIGWKRRAD
jgi:signal peptidase II